MLGKKLIIVYAIAILNIGVSYASSMVIPINLVTKDGQDKNIGTVKLEDMMGGVLITPNLHDLSPGVHGFHIHEKPSCADQGMAAGGHLDPKKTNQHNGPYAKKGHLGDMPVLLVDSDGNATLPTFAPRFKLADIKKHSIIIHVGGDNYSDKPEKLGGGGDRLACGVIAIDPNYQVSYKAHISG